MATPRLLIPLLASLLLLGACSSSKKDTQDDPLPQDTAETSPDADGKDTQSTTTPDTAEPDTTQGEDAADPIPPYARGEVCAEVDAFGPVYTDLIGRWSSQDALAPWPSEPLVLVGSSSARRWEGFAHAFTDYEPLQRGFGGAQLGEVALSAEALVLRHDPRGVMVFAGTNDVAAGVAADVVLERFACFRQRIGEASGWDTPVFFIGITPTPSRWASWETSSAVNQGVQALQSSDPALHYVDIPAAFLATGSPPADHLFVDDALHLSAEGYALWESVLRDQVEAALPPSPQPTIPAPASGQRLLVDFGPNNQGDGEDTPSPDYLGQHWNNWHALEGGQQAVPGEHLDNLRTSTGSPTDIDLIITGGFSSNGWATGGLRWPEQAHLDTLAVGSATGDFFYIEGDDITGGFFLRGLSPDAHYSLRFFASRDDAERRLTRFTVHGATTQSVTLQTSGADAGSNGALHNDDTVAELPHLQPDPWGHLFVDLSIEEGTYGYLSLLELTAD